MKGVFKCAMEDDERRSWSVKRSSLGMPMCTPNKYSRRLKRLSLGMPPCIPFFIKNYQFVLGMPMCTPNKYSRRLKRLSLGMPPCIPFFINNYQFVPRSTIFLSLHALCAMLGASHSLLF